MSFSQEPLKWKLTETDDIELLFINGCIGYETEEEKLINKEIVKTDSEMQTQRTWGRHNGTTYQKPASGDFSVTVSEKLLYDEEMGNLNKGGKLDEKVLIISRLLAENNAKKIKNKIDKNPLDIKFTYTLFEMAELKDPKLKNTQITAIARNPDLNFIYAAGFSVGNTASGGIALFSLKNQQNAEKFHFLKDAVVCLSFSKNSPNLLAVGTKNGNLLVFDVSGSQFRTMHKVSATIFDQIRVVDWWENDIIWTIGNQIIRLERPFITSKPQIIMNIAYPSSMKLANVPINLGPKITGLLKNGEKCNEYVVSGTDGALRFCSKLNLIEVHDLIEDANMQIVSGIRSVPYSLQMFLTFGCDGTVKLWSWAITETLIILKTDENLVELCDTCWSPIHATIVAACAKNAIFLWDIARKTHAPISTINTRYTCLNIQFSANGEFLIIGTNDGSVVFIGLSQMPFPEKLKFNAFRSTIIRLLLKSHKNEIIEKLIKHGIF